MGLFSRQEPAPVTLTPGPGDAQLVLLGTGYPTPQTIAAIKIVREASGMPLRQAKAVVQGVMPGVPAVIAVGPRPQLERWAAALASLGCEHRIDDPQM